MWTDYLEHSPMRLVGRFAPTPTGSLHIGNAYSALFSIISAQSMGGSALLRVDDLDVRSIPKGCLVGQLDDLDWLGLPFSEGPRQGGLAKPYRQSERFPLYEAALQELNRQGLLYPCYCTRKEIIAAAPHAQDEGYLYPNTCRPEHPVPLNLNQVRQEVKRGRRPALRLNVGAIQLSEAWRALSTRAMPDSRILSYQDKVAGKQQAHLDFDLGDFVVQRRDGIYAYQLACAVDDFVQGCMVIARGADLITSTHRQRLILMLLGVPLERCPLYAHAGLVVDAEGERLAKRNKSISLKGLREQEVSPAHLRASLSRALGGPDTDSIQEMASSFDWSQICTESVRWQL